MSQPTSERRRGVAVSAVVQQQRLNESHDEEPPPPDAPGLLPPFALRLLGVFASKTYLYMCILVTFFHVIVVAWTINTNPDAPASQFERKGWYGAFAVMLEIEMTPVSKESTEYSLSRWSRIAPRLHQRSPPCANAAYHVWAVCCQYFLHWRIPAYLQSDEYRRFLRAGGGVTGETRRFYYRSSIFWVSVVGVSGLVVLWPWVRPANAVNASGSTARSTHERVASWLLLIWVPTFPAMLFTQFLCSYFLLLCRQRVVTLARQVEVFDLLTPRPRNKRRFSVVSGPRSRVPGSTLDAEELKEILEAHQGRPAHSRALRVSHLQPDAVRPNPPTYLDSVTSLDGLRRRSSAAGARIVKHARCRSPQHSGAYRVDESVQGTPPCGCDGGCVICKPVMMQLFDWSAQALTRDAEAASLPRGDSTGVPPAAREGSDGEPEQQQQQRRDSTEPDGGTDCAAASGPETTGSALLRTGAAAAALQDPVASADPAAAAAAAAAAVAGRFKVLELQPDEFVLWAVQQCKEIAHDSSEVSSITAGVLACEAVVVLAFWIQLFLSISTSKPIWSDVYAVTSLTTTLGMTVLLGSVVYTAAYSNDAAERLAGQVPFMIHAFPRMEARPVGPYRRPTQSPASAKSLMLPCLAVGVRCCCKTKTTYAFADPHFTALQDRIGFATTLTVYQPLQVKMGTFVITHTTFLQVMLAIVGAFSGTLLRVVSSPRR